MILVALLAGDDRRRWSHVGGFVLLAGAALAATIGSCLYLWGDNFRFWVFEVTGGSRSDITLAGGNSIAVARSVDHVLRAWPELMIGVVGGLLMLWAKASRQVGFLWLGWFLLVGSEALSSGVGWAILYHFGPAVVIGTIWMLAALPLYWPALTEAFDVPPRPVGRLAVMAGGTVILLSLMIALRVVPTLDRQSARTFPERRPGPDSYRQIAAIQQEMEGVDPSKVLLDAGNWTYLPHSFLAKDRLVSLGDQPLAGIYSNFDPLLDRIRRRAYDKILLHDFHQDRFAYDWPYWERSSGVRQALLDNYVETRLIAAMDPEAALPPQIMFRGAVSVLVPKSSFASQLQRSP